MRIKPIPSIPMTPSRNSKNSNNRLKEQIAEFLDMDVECGEVEYNDDEYSSSISLYSGLRNAVAALGDPPVAVHMQHGAIYLRRTDYDG